jgi:hypothetical protein
MYETILFVGLDLYVCLPLKWDYVHGFLKIASTRACPRACGYLRIAGSGDASGP